MAQTKDVEQEVHELSKKLLYIGLTACLVLAALTPGTALAKKGGGFEEFYATGEISGIDPGTVKPAGNSGRWVVSERAVIVQFTDGTGTMTYAANVPIETQAGSFHGQLEKGDLVFRVQGKSEPITYRYDIPSGLPEPYPPSLPVYRLEFSGSWTLVSGGQGNGTFSGWADFVPTPEGHVGLILDSAFTMTGKWKP